MCQGRKGGNVVDRKSMTWHCVDGVGRIWTFRVFRLWSDFDMRDQSICDIAQKGVSSEAVLMAQEVTLCSSSPVGLQIQSMHP